MVKQQIRSLSIAPDVGRVMRLLIRIVTTTQIFLLMESRKKYAARVNERKTHH